MAFSLSRIDRLSRTIDLAKLFPGRSPFTAASVALLPPRAQGPTAATMWLPVTVADDEATALFAGPDADSTGAVVVPASADLWVKLDDAPEVDAEKVERITVLGGGAALAAPVGVPVVSVNGKTGAALTLDAEDVGALAPGDGAGGALSGSYPNPGLNTAAVDTSIAANIDDASSATARALRRGGPYLLATFGGQNNGPDELSLCIYPSVDGKNFVSSHSNPVAFSSPGMRDPSIIEVDGRFYVAVTTASFSVGQYTDDVQIWTSTDPMSRTWTLHTTLDFSGPARDVNPEVWAPKFFVDDDGQVYLFISVDQTSLWSVKATNATLTTWTAPTAVTPTPSVGGQIDPYVVRVGSTYHMFYKRTSDLSIVRATATAPQGPYTVQQTGLGWLGLDTGFAAPTGAGFEGPVVVKVGDSRWRMYLDVTHVGGLYYAETSDPNLATGWTTWAACTIDGAYVSGNGRLRHGTVLRLARPEVRGAARWNNSTPRANSGTTLQLKYRTSGNISITSTTAWVILDTNMDLVFPQCRAGDWIEAGFSGVWTATAAEGWLDFATVVNGSMVNYFSPNHATGGIGLVGLWVPNSITALFPVSAADFYQVQQSDINTDGSVRISLVGRTTSTGRALNATTTNGIRFWGRKLT